MLKLHLKLIVVGILVLFCMVSFRQRLGRAVEKAVGADRLYTRLAAEESQLKSQAELRAACDSLPVGSMKVGVAVCALAEQGHSADVLGIVRRRLAAALEAGPESNEAFMLGKAAVMCGADCLPLLDEFSSNPNSNVRVWALMNYGFLRDLDVALDRLIQRLPAAEGEELRTIIFSMSQHGSVRAGLTILEMLPQLPVEIRIAASRFLMSCPANPSLRDKAQVRYDAEQAADVKRNLGNFLSRFK